MTRVSLLLGASLLLLAGCGSDAPGSDDNAKDAAGSGGATSPPTLVLNGHAVGADGKRTSDSANPVPAKATSPKLEVPATARPVRGVARVTYRPPPLNADGTIRLDEDPFAANGAQPLPLPIEDDPGTTAGIEQLAAATRRIDVARWKAWVGGGGGALFSRAETPPSPFVVQIFVERCGGARTVATGVVLAPETVVTTVHAIESMESRVLVRAGAAGTRLGAMVRYLDVDDDIAVLRVPGLTTTPVDVFRPTGTAPAWGYAFGVRGGNGTNTLQGARVMVTMQEGVIDVEQPDGFAEQISDRSVQTLVGPVDTGFSGGPVMVTNDPDLASGWGFHGLVRARVPFRADTGGIVVPSRLVTAAIAADARLDRWFEHAPSGCPQWYR